jgi:putative membrane protein
MRPTLDGKYICRSAAFHEHLAKLDWSHPTFLLRRSEARTTWASIVSQSINMVRMSATFMDLSQDADKKSLGRLSTATWLVCRTVMHELLGPEDTDIYRADIFKSLPPKQAERILSMDDKTTAALTHASLSLDALPIDEKRRVEIDKSLVLIGNSIGTCQRIYSSPVPLVYSRHTARFLSLWMLLLPVALYEPFAAVATPFPIPALALIPAVAFVALFLFGIEELAVQLEEPFSILPMQQFCDSVRASSATIADWCARVDQDAK